MRAGTISRASVRPDPTNPGLTIPRTFGVWELLGRTGSKRYRYGNNPIRETELAREHALKQVQRLELYSDRAAAKRHADELNEKGGA